MERYKDDRCTICPKLQFNSHHHRDTLEHRFNFAIFEYNQYRKRLLRDRHGIVFDIKPQLQNNLTLDFNYQGSKGKYMVKVPMEQFLLHNNLITFQCSLQNIRRDVIYVISANLLHPSDVFRIIYNKNIDFGGDKDSVLALKPGSSYTFQIQFFAKEITTSSFLIPVVCNFQTINDEAFTIPRSILVAITDSEQENETKSKSPFTFKQWINVRYIDSKQQLHYTNNYRIPEEYLKILKFGLERFKNISTREEHVLMVTKRLLETGLNETNYRDYWHFVLWLEEVAQILMLQKYNMENVPMNIKYDDILVLEVPGLAEKRPSVIVGDLIDIRVHDDLTAYRGIVKCVNDKTIDISYVDDELVNYIKQDPNMLLDVAFTLNRLTFERMHEAVDKVACNMLAALFPNHVDTHGLSQRNFRNIDFYNKNITNNPEQKDAVIKIVNNAQISPYIVFGPPGTGKTITIVEAILQIKESTTKRILVCAPANSACDNIAIMLLPHCTKSELLRIHSDTRETSTLTEELKKYSNMEVEGIFTKMSVDEIMKFRIVVTTLMLIGRYRNYKCDCVFIDEAAQASEPETNIALGLLTAGGQLILAGDPKQLGPMVSSKCAVKYGLDISLLQRLMEYDMYKPDLKTGLHNSSFITMLKQNFRSHNDILAIPNALFYNNSLQAMSVKARCDPIVNIAVFRQINPQRGMKIFPGCAIEFCSVSSKQKKEGASPSYFNTAEVKMVVNYVKALMSLEVQVQLDQIGVITPYKRQMHKIKNALKTNGFGGIEVGTTETYQGREKRIIIISTVRAQHSLLLHDRKYNLGFVRHDQRFNVAITRAMSKLIVIGCQPVLSTDSKWQKFIEACINNKTYFGAPYVERTPAWKTEVVMRMQHFKIQDDQYKHYQKN